MALKLLPPDKRGRFWTVRGMWGGQRYECSTGTLDRGEAQAFLARFKSELGQELRADLPSPKTLAQAIDAYMALRQPRPDDRKWLLRCQQLFGGRPVAEIRPADIIALAERAMPEFSNATRNRAIVTPMAAALHYAYEQGWCDYHRFRRFKVLKLSPRQPARPEDMRQLLAATKGPRHLLLAMLYETGLRITDLLQATAPQGRAEIDIVSIAKTGQRLAPALSEELRRRIAEGPRYEGRRLFPWQTRSAVYKWLRPLCRELGIHYTPHMSRHALATALMQGGIADKEAAAYGAWKDIKSVQRYQHVEPGKIRIQRSFAALLHRTPQR